MLKMSFYALALFALLAMAACGGQVEEARQTDPQASTEAQRPAIPVERGVSLVLAEERAANISDVNYALRFDIPAAASEPIKAREVLTFRLAAPVETL